MRKQLNCNYSLKNKGQINIDLILSSVAFILFIWFYSQYVIELTTPLIDYTDSQMNQKNNIILRNELVNSFDIENFENICDFKLENMKGISVNYEIIGFNVLEKDIPSTLPNETSERVVIRRSINRIDIIAGTNCTSLSSSLQFTVPFTGVRVENSSVESTDSISYERDNYGNWLFTVNTSVNALDNYDEFRIYTNFDEDKIIIIESFNISKKYLYLGDLIAYNNCSSGFETRRKTHFNTFQKMRISDRDYLTKLSVDSWWGAK